MMKAKKPETTVVANLRKRAEARVSPRSGAADLPAAEVRRMLHELEVHQIELEMQNDELRATRTENEIALARYTDLFEFAPIGYAALALDGTVREVNHAAAKLLGRERARIVGNPFAMFLTPGDRGAFAHLVVRALADDLAIDGELELSNDQDVPTFVRITANHVVHAEALILIAITDLTERRTRDRQLATAQAALREAEKRKDDFLSVLSHELRNPLAPIRNSLFVLDISGSDRARARAARAVIDRQLGHLTRLVDDLLDVTRITRGKVNIEHERIELGELVRSTIDDQRATFEISGVRLVLSASAESCWVDGDSTRLVQVFSNLLVNAEKFTPRGGLVTVSIEREGDDVVVRVIDTGAGIAPEVVPHLFEPFSQAPQTADRARGGLGLGLAMSKGIIELLRGTIGISSPGAHRGTVVTIRLPLVEPGVIEQPAALAAARTAHRVLVIDDNIDGADSLCDILSHLGNDTRVAYNGAGGIAVAHEFSPEIIICDVGLPDMSGYDVARALRADAQLHGTYLVALTGYAQPSDRARASDAGFDRHLAKPTSMKTLERMLADAPIAS